MRSSVLIIFFCFFFYLYLNIIVCFNIYIYIFIYIYIACSAMPKMPRHAAAYCGIGFPSFELRKFAE